MNIACTGVKIPVLLSTFHILAIVHLALEHCCLFVISQLQECIYILICFVISGFTVRLREIDIESLFSIFMHNNFVFDLHFHWNISCTIHL
jgi:hypothetical protein